MTTNCFMLSLELWFPSVAEPSKGDGVKQRQMEKRIGGEAVRLSRRGVRGQRKGKEQDFGGRTNGLDGQHRRLDTGDHRKFDVPRERIR